MINNKSKFRIINDKTNNAKENMATDDSLLSLYKLNDEAIFRVYSWEESFTIGLSQKFENYTFTPLYKGNYAKRITGGGVLFHGHDISYSLVIPVELLEGFNIKESYEKICMFIINFYKKLGLKADYAKNNQNIQLSKSEFCQVGFEAYDILIGDDKIGGNAQRRTKKAIFQHGSIPLRKPLRDTFSKEIGNSLEDFGIKIDFEKAKTLLIESFQETFNIETKLDTLNQEEQNKKNKLLKEKYDYSNQSTI